MAKLSLGPGPVFLAQSGPILISCNALKGLVPKLGRKRGEILSQGPQRKPNTQRHTEKNLCVHLVLCGEFFRRGSILRSRA